MDNIQPVEMDGETTPDVRGKKNISKGGVGSGWKLPQRECRLEAGD